MTSHRNKLILVFIALFAVYVSPLRAELDPASGSFFSPQVYLGQDPAGFPVYYLDYFNTYTYDTSDDAYVYKYSFGWLYNFGGTTTDTNDIYLYDFTEDDIFYTSADTYPYFYSYNMDSYLYYFEGSDPREFYDFGTDTYISY